MQCSKCSNYYDLDIRIPKLLVECSHNICLECFQNEFHDKQIICPICQTKNNFSSIDKAPKNLALLSMIPDQFCTIHNAPQVFCMDSKQIICTHCIFERGLSTKDIYKLEDAYPVEKYEILRSLSDILNIEQKYRSNLKKAEDYQTYFKLKYRQTQFKINKIYEKIEKIVSERKELLLKSLSKDFENELNYILPKILELKQELNKIQTFKLMCNNIELENKLIFLKKSAERNQAKNLIQKLSDQFDTPHKFSSYNQDEEIDYLIKLLN